MKATRASGLLLHPTSLPGGHGIGDLGPEALRFVEFLAAGGQKLWQVLPLAPVGAGDSPYASYSAFAGEPLLISLELLVEDGLLTNAELAAAPVFSADRVDYHAVAVFKNEMLSRAYGRFRDAGAFEQFCVAESDWLNDYALYAALKDEYHGALWNTWAPELVARRPEALEQARAHLSREVRFQQWVQWIFFEQYRRLKREANRRGVRIVGDLPIFVALNSADVWAHPEIFYLDEGGEPTVVAGVPPDYFSETGQLWGNPLYRWDVLAADGYEWWVRRMRKVLEMYDLVRVDHFRGFEAYWEVPVREKTAINGRWVPGPGLPFFEELRTRLGDLPIIAEDLGLITPEVEELRDRLGLPGMKVLQFAWSDPENPYLPHNHVPNSVVYTGTHDNDTTRGWWESTTEKERKFARRYLDRDLADVSWDFIRLAHASAAELAIVPVQDVLGLGSEARMNIPGEGEHNWAWRLPPAALTPQHAKRLRDLTELYDR
ncbi:MAG: 4-alpha-glucanotransferase [Chloroflexota bacterium]|nr:4-alpha-glucanotransferase [Chloroflexota bacterium]